MPSLSWEWVEEEETEETEGEVLLPPNEQCLVTVAVLCPELLWFSNRPSVCSNFPLFVEGAQVMTDGLDMPLGDFEEEGLKFADVNGKSILLGWLWFPTKEDRDSTLFAFELPLLLFLVVMSRGCSSSESCSTADRWFNRGDGLEEGGKKAGGRESKGWVEWCWSERAAITAAITLVAGSLHLLEKRDEGDNA